MVVNPHFAFASSLNPATGRPYGPTFPRITPADQARLYQLVLEHLGVPRAHAVVGGSMGGMAALEFAAQFPALYDRVAGIATTGRTSASTVALRYMQRGVVRLDPAFHQGHYHADHPPAEGMRQARMFGLLCYRSRGEFDARFDWLPGGDGTEHGIHRYLLHNSGKFGTSYDANCWLLLSECMDLMDLGRGHPSFALGAQRIPAEKDVMLLPYNTDELMPPRELEMLGVALGGRPNAKVHFEVLSSPSGHDAFLINTPRETEALNMRLAAFLDGGVPAVRALLKEVE